ncbi:MAG TPA: hypothetical protein VH592_06685 [Gemmataceae bacterium]
MRTVTLRGERLGREVIDCESREDECNAPSSVVQQIVDFVDHFFCWAKAASTRGEIAFDVWAPPCSGRWSAEALDIPRRARENAASPHFLRR